MTGKDLEKYPWPKFTYTEELRVLSNNAQQLFNDSEFAIVGDLILCGFNELAQKLKGWEDYSVSLLLQQKDIIKLFDILLEIQKDCWKHYLKAIGKYIHVICYADDLGMQDRPQLSIELFRKLIKPYYKEMFNFIKNNTDAKLFFHSCGDIYPYISDLIEVGVDILNPVQVVANEMEPKRLKSEFGSNLTFWGGIDIQFTLNSEKRELREKIIEIVGILNVDGGFILAPGHNIQEDIPPQNIVELFDYNKNCF